MYFLVGWSNWIMGVKRSGFVFFPIPHLYLCCWTRLPGKHTHSHKCKQDDKKMAHWRVRGGELKVILSKIRPEEEALRKGTPTVYFLQQYILPSWPTLRTQYTAGGATVHDPHCLLPLWTRTNQIYNGNLQSAVGPLCESHDSVWSILSIQYRLF